MNIPIQKKLTETQTAKTLKRFTRSSKGIPEQYYISIKNNIGIASNEYTFAMVLTHHKDGVYEIDKRHNKLIPVTHVTTTVKDPAEHEELLEITLEHFYSIRNLVRLAFLQKKKQSFQELTIKELETQHIHEDTNSFIFHDPNNEASTYTVNATNILNATKTTNKPTIFLGLPDNTKYKDLVSIVTDKAQVFIRQL